MNRWNCLNFRVRNTHTTNLFVQCSCELNPFWSIYTTLNSPSFAADLIHWFKMSNPFFSKHSTKRYNKLLWWRREEKKTASKSQTKWQHDASCRIFYLLIEAWKSSQQNAHSIKLNEWNAKNGDEVSKIKQITIVRVHRLKNLGTHTHTHRKN